MKLDRLLAMTMLLLNRKRVTAKEFADRFEVSLRTVYRDLETLNCAGIPIVSYAGVSGGYEIMDGYRLDRQLLSIEELMTIISALKGMRQTLDDEGISELLDKVGALVSKSEQPRRQERDNELLIDFNPWHDSKLTRDYFNRLRGAIRERKLVRLDYTDSSGEASERIVEPMSVMLKGYVWYLHGFCRLREDSRTFRLSRIAQVEVLPEAFERREDLEDRILSRWDRWWGPEEPPDLLNVVLHFSPNARVRVYDQFPRETITKQEDGSLIVRRRLPDEAWIFGAILEFGADVRVLEPEKVRQGVQAEAQKIVELYRKS